MGYRGTNGIHEDVREISLPLIYLVQISKPEDEPVTRGMPYNVTVLNSPITGHLGQRIISYNW